MESTDTVLGFTLDGNPRKPKELSPSESDAQFFVRMEVRKLSVSICPSIYLSVSVHLSPSVYLSVHLIHLSLCLSICLSIHLSIYLSIYLSVCLSICLSVCPFLYLSVCLSICLSIYLSVCLTSLSYTYFPSETKASVFSSHNNTLPASFYLCKLYIIICLFINSIYVSNYPSIYVFTNSIYEGILER